MVALARITQAPVPLRIGRRTWQLSALTLGDLGTLEAWLAEIPFDEIHRRVSPWRRRREPERWMNLLAEAEKLSVRLEDLSSPEAQAQLNSLPGIAYTFWLALRKCHPRLTLWRTKRLLFVADVRRLTRAIDKANWIEADDSADDDVQTTKAVDWELVFIYLSERYGFTPRTIIDMPIPTALAYVRGGKQKEGRPMTPKQLRSFCARLREKYKGNGS